MPVAQPPAKPPPLPPAPPQNTPQPDSATDIVTVAIVVRRHCLKARFRSRAVNTLRRGSQRAAQAGSAVSKRWSVIPDCMT
ncbi:hypothetical protein ADM96_09280 [Burkholderia sp. ST111]|nr:hypothetical protein ADM96_09280 [Burkholderia sp. ST111]